MIGPIDRQLVKCSNKPYAYPFRPLFTLFLFTLYASMQHIYSLCLLFPASPLSRARHTTAFIKSSNFLGIFVVVVVVFNWCQKSFTDSQHTAYKCQQLALEESIRWFLSAFLFCSSPFVQHISLSKVWTVNLNAYKRVNTNWMGCSCFFRISGYWLKFYRNYFSSLKNHLIWAAPTTTACSIVCFWAIQSFEWKIKYEEMIIMTF